MPPVMPVGGRTRDLLGIGVRATRKTVLVGGNNTKGKSVLRRWLKKSEVPVIGAYTSVTGPMLPGIYHY